MEDAQNEYQGQTVAIVEQSSAVSEQPFDYPAVVTPLLVIIALLAAWLGMCLSRVVIEVLLRA